MQSPNHYLSPESLLVEIAVVGLEHWRSKVSSTTHPGRFQLADLALCRVLHKGDFGVDLGGRAAILWWALGLLQDRLSLEHCPKISALRKQPHPNCLLPMILLGHTRLQSASHPS